MRDEIIKFRSMRNDAEKDGKALWAQTSDPRVTRVGAILRKSRSSPKPQNFRNDRIDFAAFRRPDGR